MFLFFFFFKQKTAYEMRISDWSSDVCSSDLQSHRIVSPLLPDTQLAYDGITELWYDSLDDALNMGKDPAHRKYNIPDEPLFVDMDGLKFTFFEEDIIRSRPAVDDPDDAAVQWSPTE